MKKLIKSRFSIALLCVLTFAKAQTYFPSSNLSQISSSLGLRTQTTGAYERLTPGDYQSIDENEYQIDAGDELTVKIDPPGPEIKTYSVKITSDGYFVVPDAPGIYLRGMKLCDARQKVSSHLKKYCPDSEVEFYLEKVHPIKINLTGALEIVKDWNLNSGYRLFDFLEQLITVYRNDSLLNLKLNQASLRNVSLKQSDTTYSFDWWAYRTELTQQPNPYLRDNDLINIPYRDTSYYLISIAGAVGNETKFEFKPGDDLHTALTFAGSVLPSADSNRIEVYRFKGKSDQFDILTLQIPRDLHFLLLPDDRIYVRTKPLFHSKAFVIMTGELKYPGIYPIEEDRTTLSEVVRQAGGFSPYASIKHARLYRILGVPGGAELRKLIQSMPQSMSLSWIEGNFWRSAAKENLSIVACDFEKLFNQKDKSQEVVLKNLDKIFVPSTQSFVFVTGAVVNPGTVPYVPNWTYRDYIRAAGGAKNRARLGRIKVIKHNTETWLDVKQAKEIEPGDRIFIPLKDEQEPWTIFMQGLTVVTQIITIIIVLRNINPKVTG